MKRLLLLLVLVGGLVLAVGAQDLEDPAVIRRLGLNQEEVARLAQIRTEMQRTIREAQLELDVLRAQIKRRLFETDVDLKEVERMLRQALEWEYRVRWAEITGQVEVRRLLGDVRWARLNRMARDRATDPDRDRDPAGPGPGERTAAPERPGAGDGGRR